MQVHKNKTLWKEAGVEDVCNPDQAPVEPGFDPITNRIICDNNRTQCSTKTCLCDENLAWALAQLEPNPEFVTNEDGSGFDPSTGCRAAENNDGENNVRCLRQSRLAFSGTNMAFVCG